MTSAVNPVVDRFLAADDYARLAKAADLLAIGLLIALLVQYELVRAYRGELRPTMRPLLIAIAPLLPVFLMIVVVRSAGLR